MVSLFKMRARIEAGEKGERKSESHFGLRRISFVGGGEFLDEAGKHFRVDRIGAGMVDEVKTAAAENLSGRRRCEVMELGLDPALSQVIEDFFGLAHDAAIEGIDEERQFF